MSVIAPEPPKGPNGKPLAVLKCPEPPRLTALVDTSAATAKKIAMKKVVIVCNPKGGSGKAYKTLQKVVLPIFQEANIETEVKLTERPMHAAEYARTLPLEGVSVLCAIGGDGTLSELVTGFMEREDYSEMVSHEKASEFAIGFLPGGTGNATMREFSKGGRKGRPSVADAARAIAAGVTRLIDVNRCECVNHTTGVPLVRYSINGAFWGLGTDANLLAEKLRCLGPIRYDLAIVAEILKLKRRPAKLTVDVGEATEKRFEFDMLLMVAMNTKYTGDGLALSPYAQMDDGKFDLVFNSSPIKSRLQAIKLFDGVKAGGKHVYDRAVTVVQASSLRLETPKPTRLNFDGENVGATPLDMKLIPKALRIIVPEVMPPSEIVTATSQA